MARQRRQQHHEQGRERRDAEQERERSSAPQREVDDVPTQFGEDPGVVEPEPDNR